MGNHQLQPPSIHSDLCMDPVCMATTVNLIREVKKRYGTGAFILIQPVPPTQEEFDKWVVDSKKNGFAITPSHYVEQNNYWGNSHAVLGLLNRLIHCVNIDLDETQVEAPEDERF